MTGFDAPCLPTMDADKSMQGHDQEMSNDEFGRTNDSPSLFAPDEAVKTVLAQAELLCAEWA